MLKEHDISNISLGFTRSEPHAINYWLLDSISGDRQGMVAHISDPNT